VAPPTSAELAATATKIQQYRLLTSVAFKHRAARTVSRDALELAGKLLASTPDVYTLWNYVREIIVGMEGELDDGSLRSLVEAQLALTSAALKRSPKSYPAWHARRWLVERYRCGRPGAAAPAEPPYILLQSELALCSVLLAEDERNFHCWNYRRWVAAAGGGGDGGAASAAELAFTGACISKNFSNYSAWHARSHLLQAGGVGAGVVAEGACAARVATPAAPPVVSPRSPACSPHHAPAELKLVRAAVFTEPDDQSAWIYRRWVVDCAGALLRRGGEEAAAAAAALEEDVAELAALEAAEPSCKWPVEARARTLGALLAWGRGAGAGAGAGADAGADADARALASLYGKLEALDPRHAQYWRHALAQCTSPPPRAVLAARAGAVRQQQQE
jgi:geranylgeranyl transferase type-2 subunit alpha